MYYDVLRCTTMCYDVLRVDSAGEPVANFLIVFEFVYCFVDVVYGFGFFKSNKQTTNTKQLTNSKTNTTNKFKNTKTNTKHNIVCFSHVVVFFVCF